MSWSPVKIALAASITLNVFIVAAGAGYLISESRRPPPPGQGRPHGGLIRAGDALQPADRTAYVQVLRAEAKTQRPTVMEARTARAHLLDLLRAPFFDRQAAGATMDLARADDTRARANAENAILNFAVRLSPAERAALADGLKATAPMRWTAPATDGSGPTGGR